MTALLLSVISNPCSKVPAIESRRVSSLDIALAISSSDSKPNARWKKIDNGFTLSVSKSINSPLVPYIALEKIVES